jgi:hypothetical protein
VVSGDGAAWDAVKQICEGNTIRTTAAITRKIARGNQTLCDVHSGADMVTATSVFTER